MTGKPTVNELGVDLDAQEWRRSGDRDGAIEIAFVSAHALAGAAQAAPAAAQAAPGAAAERTEYVLMRVAGDPAGRVLVYDRHEWECFLDGVRAGEFDDDAS